MHLMMSPQRFDVLLTENLFGDILSDEAAALSGSLGMLASAAIGGAVDLYEPVHGSAPDIAGRGIANPLGAIASVAMLLRYSTGLPRWADDVEAAISKVLDDGYRTPDIYRDGSGKLCSTGQMGELVAGALLEITEMKHCYHAI
jgi:3-isopropylmalate dehydrogenase